MRQEEQFHRIFAQIPEILMHDEILNLDIKVWSIVASKKVLETGRVLDLLLKGPMASGYGYKLIELKDVQVKQPEVDQVFDYCSTLNRSGEISQSEYIEPIVLSTQEVIGRLNRDCANISPRVGTCPRLASGQTTCSGRVTITKFDPGVALNLFRRFWIDKNKYFQMKPKQVIFYLEAFGMTHKVYRLYLNKITHYISTLSHLPLTLEQLYSHIVRNNELNRVFYGRGKPSLMTFKNYIAQCIVFGLVRVERIAGEWNLVSLTARGERYVKAGLGLDEINADQAQILVDDVLLENPFAHGAILGICLFVESVFELSKNVIPVPHSYLCPHFLKKAGTERDWGSERNRREVPIHYGNIAQQLGLARRQSSADDITWYLTPLGIDTVVRFQLAKAVRMLF
ncbi:MAG: hypothetical protein ACFFER_19830 [Candidatus Thorarchaeota archaeon]